MNIKILTTKLIKNRLVILMTEVSFFKDILNRMEKYLRNAIVNLEENTLFKQIYDLVY